MCPNPQLQTYHSDFETERKSREQMAGRMGQMRDEQEKKDFEIKQLKSQLNKSAANLMKAEMAEMEVDRNFNIIELGIGVGWC